MKPLTVLAISGSLRAESYTTKLVHAFAALAPEGVRVNVLPVGDLPFLNEDLEADLPAPVRNLHEQIAAADAVLLASPEYNRSYSPVIKNALDWGSRPAGQNAWDGKPVAIIGCTPYTMGGSGAVHHLQQVVAYVNMHPLQQPEFYLSGAGEKFDESGKLTDASTEEHIKSYWAAFTAWAEKIRS
ncbi:MAG TPA: NAD(P)H-dependent oxidoreductase [Candidatus Saccharimonadales bacterium]|nr:NAD(P)H-dependent oxidoreductase [Candidatus Saccharimonadales bacterium]